ncbi:MAG: ornithine--oxo-acid transaminase [Candidatus Hodarchaeales archaeon]|jgi:ornithine--oxo-acid transaminase
MNSSKEYIEYDSKYGAHNYHPIPVVITKAEGVWVYDPEGRKYLDCLSAYSAVNQGHLHPKIVAALKEQLTRVALTSRAFHNDRMGLFLKHLLEICGDGFDMALPMNTGAEAVETALKMARRWGYEIKGVEKDKAEIIVCENNFHGRTTTIVGFSTDPDANTNFGPYTPGFKIIPYNDPESLEKAITPNTVGFLVEPIQGEAGVIVPSEGYLKQVRKICTDNNILLILDEIQTGFCRTGKMFCHQHEGIIPDVMTLGKALGGGVLPVSAVVSRKEIMSVFTPGSHGSTFGGFPLACAVGDAALSVLIDEKLDERSMELGNYFISKLREISHKRIKEIRGKGLFVAIELNEKARPFTQKIIDNGILAKETHDFAIRFTPPLVITKDELDWAINIIKDVLES